jgi:hypothetical protein
MRTANAWTARLRTQALGRTYKVQETNHSLSTITAYRGAAACYAINYEQLLYLEMCKCDYITTCNFAAPSLPLSITYDGGDAIFSGNIILDGGNPLLPGTRVIDGGIP